MEGARWSRGPPATDEQDVGRTNWIILCFGFGACLALSLMMQHLLDVQVKEKRPRIAVEIDSTFGSRLSSEAQFDMRQVGSRSVAEIRLQPLAGLAMRRLAFDVGLYAWRRLDGKERDPQVEALVVVLDDKLRSPEIYQVFPPTQLRPARRIDGDTEIEWIASRPAASSQTTPMGAAPRSSEGRRPPSGAKAPGTDAAPAPQRRR